MTRRPANDAKLRLLFSAGEVAARIDALAGQLAAELGANTRPLVVVIAEGARRFASALTLRLAVHGLASDSVEVRARRSFGTALHPVALEDCDRRAFAGRHVLVTDDIADEGRTLEAVCALVRGGAPASMRVAVLVSKLHRRAVPLALDYVGFELERGWVVGYGMDLDGRLRELDWIGVVENSD